MMETVRKPYSLLCDIPIYLNSVPLICNTYMRLNREFVLRTLADSAGGRELLIVHPGTDRLLSDAVVSTAFAGIFKGEISIQDYYRQFQRGDIVIRGVERYRFGEVKDGMCVLISDNNKFSVNNKTYVQIEHGLDIRLYSGTSLRTGTHGGARSLIDASEYLQDIVGAEYRNQVITMPLCTLVVSSREQAKSIAENLAFIDGNKSYRFADMFSLAWAHSIDDLDVFFGSVGKADPAVIFTDRVSIARDFLYDDYRERIYAVILSDIEPHIPKSEIGDIQDLLERRENGHLIMLQSEDKVSESLNESISESAQTIIWSPKVLLSTIDDLYHETDSPDDRAIMSAINRRIDSSFERKFIKAPASFDELPECRVFLKRLIRFKQRTPEIDEFILNAFGLINLFEQAAFTMMEYERYIAAYSPGTRSPKNQVKRLYELATAFANTDYADDAELTAMSLEVIYDSLTTSNPKRTALLEKIGEAKANSVPYRILVPKRGFIGITRDVCACGEAQICIPQWLSHDMEITRLIITATPNVKKDGYNPLAGRAALETILLEYGIEIVKNDCYQRLVSRAFQSINRSAKKCAQALFGDGLEDETFELDIPTDESVLEEAETVEMELVDIETESVIGQEISGAHTGASTMHAIRLAQFDTGEWALLSRHYSAYALDIKTQKIVEKSPVDLLPGDIVVFSATGNEITDFVDDILNRLVQRGNIELADHYERSKRWKHVLSEYIRKSALTYQDVSDRMRDCGHPRHAATVGAWLREDSVIVGPRDEDAYIAIGLAVEDDDIADNAKQYKESCDVIRSQRMRILDYVQSSIVRSVIGAKNKPKGDSLSKEETIYLGDVSKYARRLTIERIVPCDRAVPSHLVNRPVGR